ncbi:aldehyde dehydrogenase [Macrolepiota fuliginosa MF-IS2]|uniref:Aldehyde dehydrogenase n=1 Tax=Macrolepiota fuliginosa MF-IS2 TaxID=1400762 RepID=A0A9P6C1K8_9AGAR|nr:aldehyde dehydrogenase [Macrolepiota fuliginosa MF-IS2]
MPKTYTHHFDTPTFKGSITVNTGLYINGKWVDPVEGGTVDVIDPANGKVITPVSIGTGKDIDIAVSAARQAFKTTWGLHASGAERGRLMNKLADLLEKHRAELCALEALNVGKTYAAADAFDLPGVIRTIRYYAGWADKIHGKTIETTENKMAYTRHEPYGVVGCIIPWNFPLLMASWKLGPSLSTGNAIVLKPSEMTPLTMLKVAELIHEAGFPPGVVNIINGLGGTAGAAIASHPKIDKVAFTGSTLTGRKILKASSETNLKVVTLELGGKSPTIIFDDADLDQTLKWASVGIFANMGQSCVAASRIFVQEGIYDKFLSHFTQLVQHLTANTGSPFDPKTQHGPQISQTQFDRVMGFIHSGKKEGAKIAIGGERHGNEGYFIQPTVFTGANPKMSIMQDEIFGPVCSVVKFKTEEEVLEVANDVAYGLGANVFTENTSRAIRVAHALEAGSIWVNCAQATEMNVPFGGYKQSGTGRELGQYALDTYTQVKAVHINIGQKL